MTCAIILAAGQSRRMGTQKLLLPYAGKTMIAQVVDQALAGPIGETIVVIPDQADGVRAALAGRRIRFVINPDPQGDMLSSARCGVRALPPSAHGVVVLLGDQPAITTELLGKMIGAFATSGRGLVVPLYEGRRGHPLLFSSRYAEEILTRYDGVGLRGLLEAHPEDIHELPVAAPGVLTDVDSPADYQRELRRLEQERPA